MHLAYLLFLLSAFLAQQTVRGTVVDSFKNSNCRKFFYEKEEPAGFNSQNYARVCQTFRNRIYFASLYDKTRRIPLYSASLYNYKDPNDTSSETTEKNWKYEPQVSLPILILRLALVSRVLCSFQLVNHTKGDNMEKITENVKNDPKVRDSQPVEIDYQMKYYNMYYTRGHLVPNSFMASPSSKSATFTVSNAPPQPRGFNQKQWSEKEEEIAKKLDASCHVVSGVLPYETEKWIPEDRHRVAVPQFVWMAYKCPNIPPAAVLGYSDGNAPVDFDFGQGCKVKLKPKEIKDITVSCLESILASRIPSQSAYRIFTSGCGAHHSNIAEGTSWEQC
ncbi:ENDD1 protein, partial [Atractosteus spatula]|nr:ENDD1 protein [Atractosteus spatula]